jgi:hypothetical protein
VRWITVANRGSGNCLATSPPSPSRVHVRAEIAEDDPAVGELAQLVEALGEDADGYAAARQEISSLQASRGEP